MVKVFGAEGALKTASSHSEGHGVHMDETWFGFGQGQLFFFGIFVVVYRRKDFNSLSSSHSDTFSEGFKPRMVGDMVVVYILALGDGVVDWFLESEEGDAGDGERNS